MKKLTIISALLVLTLGLSAQSNNNRRSRSTEEPAQERKATEKKETTVKPAQSKPAATRPAPSATRTRTTPDNNSQGRVSRSSNSNQDNNGVSRSSRESRSSSYDPSTRRSSETRSKGSSGSATRTRETDTRQASPANSSQRRAGTTSGSNYGTRKANTTAQPGGGKAYHYDPKVGTVYKEKRRVYTTPAPRRAVRPTTHIHYVPQTVEYRRSYYPYAKPSYVNVIWTRNMYREYVYLYPEFDLWYYPYGYSIRTISAYDAGLYVGEVARIYGKVYETWYSRETGELFLYFGAPYPYQDFSVVLSENDARRFSRRPDRFFEGRHVVVTGLVSLWEGKPEIVVKKRHQVEIY